MSVKILKQHLIEYGLPTDGLKPALAERLTQAMQIKKKKKKKKIEKEGMHKTRCCLSQQERQFALRTASSLAAEGQANMATEAKAMGWAMEVESTQKSSPRGRSRHWWGNQSSV